MATYKPKRLLNDGTLEDIKFTLDSFDGASDVNFTEIEIDETVTENSENLVTSGAVYTEIMKDRSFVKEITSYRYLPYYMQGFEDIKIPNLTVGDIEELAQAFEQHKGVYVHFKPQSEDGQITYIDHHFAVEAANYSDAVGTNHYCEVHLHGDIDLSDTIGQSFCIELLYQCSDLPTVFVETNPVLLCANGLAEYAGCPDKLPNINGAYISTPLAVEAAIGLPMRILYKDTNQDGNFTGIVHNISVLSNGVRDNNQFYLSFLWKDKHYTLYKVGEDVHAEAALAPYILKATDWTTGDVPVFEAEDLAYALKCNNNGQPISAIYAKNNEGIYLNIFSFLTHIENNELVGQMVLTVKAAYDSGYHGKDYDMESTVVYNINSDGTYTTRVIAENGRIICDVDASEKYDIRYPRLSDTQFNLIASYTSVDKYPILHTTGSYHTNWNILQTTVSKTVNSAECTDYEGTIWVKGFNMGVTTINIGSEVSVCYTKTSDGDIITKVFEYGSDIVLQASTNFVLTSGQIKEAIDYVDLMNKTNAKDKLGPQKISLHNSTTTNNLTNTIVAYCIGYSREQLTGGTGGIAKTYKYKISFLYPMDVGTTDEFVYLSYATTTNANDTDTIAPKLRIMDLAPTKDSENFITSGAVYSYAIPQTAITHADASDTTNTVYSTKYIDTVVDTLKGQNEFIGTTQVSATTETDLAAELNKYVQDTTSRAARKGDIVNTTGTYNNIQWYYNGTNWVQYSVYQTPTGTITTNNTTAQVALNSADIHSAINLHKVASTGTYSDLIGAPVKSTSENDAGYVTLAQLKNILQACFSVSGNNVAIDVTNDVINAAANK